MSNPHAISSTSAKRKRTREAPPLCDEENETAAPLEHVVDAQFASYKRAEVSARHPQWSAQRVTTEIRRQWKAMTATEQQPWVELSIFDKESAPVIQQRTKETVATRDLLPSKRSNARDEPRQPDTPYICFWKYARPAVVAMYPTMSAPNVSKEVGSRWRELADEERQEWKDLAALDRQRYEKEMAAYRNTKAAAKTSPSAEAASGEAALPELPKTGFQCFLSHNSESLALLHMTVDEFRDEMSELWARMDGADKQVWFDLAAQDRRRYETQMAALNPTPDVETTKKRLDQLKAKAKSMADAPALPQTANGFFGTAKRQKLLQQNPTMKLNDMNREVSRLWKAMDAYEKLPYISKAQRDVDRFVRSMEKIEAEQRDGDKERAVDRMLLSAASATTPFAIVAPNGKWRRKTKAATPRKPMNAFNMMYLAKREELMATYQLTQNECSALCGRMWRQMPDAERKQYQEMAAQDKQRYVREMRELAGNRETTRAETSRVPAWDASAHRDDISLLSSVDEDSSFDELRRLEQSARAVFESPTYDDDDVSGDSRSHHTTPGFECFVQARSSERGREHWTSSMWVNDWASMTASHRVVWEDMAAAKQRASHTSHTSTAAAAPSGR